MYCPRKEKLKGLAVVLPFTVILFIFVYGFIGWSFRVSLSAWDGVMPNMEFVGFANYREMFKSQRFITDLWNTLFFTIIFMAVCVVGGFILSYIVYSGLKAESFFRTIYMYPLSISFIVSGVIWKWILTPSEGINKLLQNLGFNATFGWYTSTQSIGHFNLALISLVIAACWQYVGYTMAMYLAGLRGIPVQLIESAKIDGAGEWKIVTHVLLPQVKPITFSALIVLGHISLKIFDLVYAMTGPGPRFVTDFPGLFMFTTTFRGNHYAEGAVIAIVMLLLVALVIVPYLISTFKGEDA